MSQTFAREYDAYKEHYANEIASMLVKDQNLSPLLSCFDARPYAGDGMGRTFAQPIEVDAAPICTPDFTISQAKSEGTGAGSSGLIERWELTKIELNSFATWTRAAMLATEGKSADETYDVVEAGFRKATNDMRKQICISLAGDGFGGLAEIVSINSGSVTVDPLLLNRFMVGEDLLAAAAAKTGNVRSATARQVTRHNPANGYLQLSADPEALSWAPGDTLFRNGCREQSATPTVKMPIGLPGWLDPDAITAGATFEGVNRTGRFELCGLPLDCSGLDHAQACIAASRLSFAYGSGEADTLFLSPKDYEILATNKDAVRLVDVSLGKYKVGWQGLMLDGMAGNGIKIVADPFLRQGKFYLGPFNNPDYCPYLVYAKKLINTDDIDGASFLRQASAAGYQARFFSHLATCLPTPGKYVVGYGLSATA